MNTQKKIKEKINILTIPDYEDDNYIDKAIDAVDSLKELLSKEELPQYLFLADSDDWWIRELAAELLSHFLGIMALPKLFEIKHRGSEEGLDNDGLNDIIISLVLGAPVKGKSVLQNILAGKYQSFINAEYCGNNREKMEETVQWALSFIED